MVTSDPRDSRLRSQKFIWCFAGSPSNGQPSHPDSSGPQGVRLVEKKIQDTQVQHIDPSLPLQILIFPTPHSPMAVIVQQNDLAEWLFLPNNFVKSLPSYVELISELINPSKYSRTSPWSFKLNIKRSYSPHWHN